MLSAYGRKSCHDSALEGVGMLQPYMPGLGRWGERHDVKGVAPAERREGGEHVTHAADEAVVECPREHSVHLRRGRETAVHVARDVGIETVGIVYC